MKRVGKVVACFVYVIDYFIPSKSSIKWFYIEYTNAERELKFSLARDAGVENHKLK